MYAKIPSASGIGSELGPESGIAIGPILWVVAILAVLAMAISAGFGTFNGDTSAVKIKAQATAILGYVDELQIGVDRVMSRCPDTQISLANSVDSGYAENPLAPSDKSCHVFDVNGGGILFKEPPPDVDLTGVPEELRHYFIHTANELWRVGMTSDIGINNIGRDLIIVLPGIKKELCLKINDILGVPLENGDAHITNNIAARKIWDYYTLNTNGYHSSCNANGVVTCCIKLGVNVASPLIPSDSYIFIHTLHVR
ncbi:MAG: hypothetical protein IPI58_06470 [Alphaproteobacteria bacterium]|nr:MAG: hypothetical protein IPI58_06470 [Alphaproteobacteria bacterium]